MTAPARPPTPKPARHAVSLPREALSAPALAPEPAAPAVVETDPDSSPAAPADTAPDQADPASRGDAQRHGRRQTIVLAAGGTGGHMFPALAVAAVLRAEGQRPVILTDTRGARYLGPKDEHRLLASASPSGPLARKLTGLGKLGLGGVQALRHVAALRPAAVAGFGSYAMVGPALAAVLLRKPLLLHEQNAVMGRANRALGRFAAAIALSFAPTEAMPEALRAKAQLTGNPVRDLGDVRPQALSTDGRLRVLVLGGSQGASVFASIIPALLARLSPDERARIVLSQQCRAEDFENCAAAFRELGMSVDLARFFDDAPQRMAASDLIITRSGASTVAELLHLGKPSWLLPYPHAADDHQHANAKRLSEQGAARLFDARNPDSAAMAQGLRDALRDTAELGMMAVAARRMAKPEAAATIAATLSGLAAPAVIHS